MPNNLDANFPLSPEPYDELKPWEQRSFGGGSSASSMQPTSADGSPIEAQLAPVDGDQIADHVENQTDLAYYAATGTHSTPDSDLTYSAEYNAALWAHFHDDHLYDTRRVTLDHFHLFEWFPLTPGAFHRPQAYSRRRQALEALRTTSDGRVILTPAGKGLMLEGGYGTVRLRPRRVDGVDGRPEPHYFMTASSNGICHEGFPVLIPRSLYGQVKARLLQDGAAPVELAGEMRYIPDDAATIFGRQRAIPRLYLHVETLRLLPQPRADVTRYVLSVAVAFAGSFDGRPGNYVTYGVFEPDRPQALERTCAWLEEYVVDWHNGAIVTDFDETQPRFPNFPAATFGLAAVLGGTLDAQAAAALLARMGVDPALVAAGRANAPVINNYINTNGGAYVAGDVQAGRDFIGRDRID